MVSVDPLDVVRGVTTALLAVFWGLTWWAAKTAREDGEASGNTPASWNWILGQVNLGLGITLVFVPLTIRLLLDMTLDLATRTWIGLVVMLFCVTGKWFTRRGFAIHRDSAGYRRDGPPDGE